MLLNYLKLRIYLLTGNTKIRFPGMVCRIIASLYTSKHPHPTPQNLWVSYLTYGKRDFANVIKLRIWGWGKFLDLPTGPNIITMVFIRELQEGLTENKTTWQWKQEAAICMEVALGQGIQVVSRRWKRQSNSPLRACRRISPASTWLAQWNWFWTCDLQNCKVIHVCFLCRD